MAKLIGGRAVVIGGGLGGLAAAAALADHFAQVVVLERDRLPRAALPRDGVPQGKHPHVLLLGGQRALAALAPGFEEALAGAGAVPMCLGLDGHIDWPGHDPLPQRDLGATVYSASRALIEETLRRHVVAMANVTLREGCRAEALLVSGDGARVEGVRHSALADGGTTTSADLVIDASGRGALTIRLLEETGRQLPEETEIGIQLAYATAVYAIPEDAPADWKFAVLFPNPRESNRRALLIPIEGNRWIVSMVSFHGEMPPDNPAGFLEFARTLRTPTIFQAIRNAKLLEPITRFAYPGSTWRHFERLADFPRGLLPIADAVCRFNPVYGQGMSVAAQEAALLRRLLGDLAGHDDPLGALAGAFFRDMPAILASPWSTAQADLAYPQTTGARPADFAQTMQFSSALVHLAVREPDVHQTWGEVVNLVRSPAVYREPALQRRVQAVMAEMAAAPRRTSA